MSMIRRLSLLLVLAAAPLAALAQDAAGRDVLELKDGRKLEGAVVAETPEGVTFRAGGTTRFYPAGDVARTAKAQPAAAPAAAPGDAPAAGPAADPAAPAKPGLEKAKRPKALTEESRKWVRELAARASTAQDETVRRSIVAALKACGPVAVPTIREAALAETDAGARAYLEALATEMEQGRMRRDAPPPAAGAKPPMPGEDGMGDPAGGMPGEKPGVGDGPRRGRGGLFDRVAQELELRDDQRLRFMGVLGGLEKSRGQAFKEYESGGTLDAARAKLADAKKAVLEGAKGVLDEGQLAAFEPMVDRYVMDQENRLAKVAAKKGPDAPAETPPEKQ